MQKENDATHNSQRSHLLQKKNENVIYFSSYICHSTQLNQSITVMLKCLLASFLTIHPDESSQLLEMLKTHSIESYESTV